jgi:iron-sulfur cluster insertion protein
MFGSIFGDASRVADAWQHSPAFTGRVECLNTLQEHGSRAGKHMSEVAPEVGERRIQVSESAARRIAVLKQQEEAQDAFLRIAVSGGGCSGFQYGLSFDEQRNPDDFVFEHGEIAVVVDDVSLDLLNGAELDFVEDLMGASFQIKNPNAASSCGCGNSFSI